MLQLCGNSPETSRPFRLCGPKPRPRPNPPPRSPANPTPPRVRHLANRRSEPENMHLNFWVQKWPFEKKGETFEGLGRKNSTFLLLVLTPPCETLLRTPPPSPPAMPHENPRENPRPREPCKTALRKPRETPRKPRTPRAAPRKRPPFTLDWCLQSSQSGLHVTAYFFRRVACDLFRNSLSLVTPRNGKSKESRLVWGCSNDP